MALQIINLSKKYGGQSALCDINLAFNKNEIVGLLGPNGAGKSTLMKTVAGVLDVEEGKVLFNGTKLSKHPLDVKKNIGFLPENNPLYVDMYVKEYLQFVADIHKCPRRRIAEVIGLVGLNPEQDKKINQLSKGYRQRVGLAQALIHEPELLILDEPTNGLDPNQIIEIRNLIKETAVDRTVIFSTHVLQEVEALCTRVVLIHHGKIIKDLPIEAFLSKFKTLEEAFRFYTDERSDF